jgi:hypothetical protein
MTRGLDPIFVNYLYELTFCLLRVPHALDGTHRPPGGKGPPVSPGESLEPRHRSSGYDGGEPIRVPDGRAAMAVPRVAPACEDCGGGRGALDDFARRGIGRVVTRDGAAERRLLSPGSYLVARLAVAREAVS